MMEKRTQKVKPVIIEFKSYKESIKEALDKIDAKEVFIRQKAILVKPNLVESVPPPITTPAECCEHIINYIRSCSRAEIKIAEGCGAADYDTEKCFSDLGYEELSKRLNIPLINLNKSKIVKLKNSSCRIFPEFYMPEIAMNHYIISVPVLKAHSLADITGALKNMMGFAPSKYYQKGGHWKKSFFHRRMHQSIIELNKYRKADMTVMDARIGMAEYHLGGPECDPPVNKIITGYDPLEIDRISAGFLGLDWEKIGHLR